MGRKRTLPGWRARIAAALLLVLLAGGGWFWWQMLHWTPPEGEFPDQGAEIAAADGPVNFATLHALGADFVYLDASSGERGEDARFSRNLTAARDAGLQVGAVHAFDPCAMADGQSANFVTKVPRGTGMLPPAIALDKLADDCAGSVGDAAVESELMTLINQIEAHAGRPVILKVSAAFEDRYGLAHRLERNMWLERSRFQPTYAGRPWLLWTANDSLRSEAAEEPIRWVVVRP